MLRTVTKLSNFGLERFQPEILVERETEERLSNWKE